ncbi:MAG: hypothetical protein QME64_09485, partial [bacterium]|nr:hypothetical protein [bacterium]
MLPITVWLSGLSLIPFVLYGIVSIISAVSFAVVDKRPALIFLIPPVYIIMHFAYSCGLIWALLRRYSKKPEGTNPVEVNIRVV